MLFHFAGLSSYPLYDSHIGEASTHRAGGKSACLVKADDINSGTLLDHFWMEQNQAMLLEPAGGHRCQKQNEKWQAGRCNKGDQVQQSEHDLSCGLLVL